LLPTVFLVHEDVDVLANVALLVEDPTFDVGCCLEGPAPATVVPSS
jgi:hypothetical protein